MRFTALDKVSPVKWVILFHSPMRTFYHPTCCSVLLKGRGCTSVHVSGLTINYRFIFSVIRKDTALDTAIHLLTIRHETHSSPSSGSNQGAVVPFNPSSKSDPGIRGIENDVGHSGNECHMFDVESYAIPKGATTYYLKLCRHDVFSELQ